MNKFDEFKHKEALFMCSIGLKEEEYSSPKSFLKCVQEYLDEFHPIAIELSEAMKLENPELNFTKNLIVLYNFKKDEGYDSYPILHCNLSKLTNESIENVLKSYLKFEKSKELFVWIGLERENHNFNSLLTNYTKHFVDVAKYKIHEMTSFKSGMAFSIINLELNKSSLSSRESFVDKIQEVLINEYLSILTELKNSPEFDMASYTKDLMVCCNNE